MTVRADINLAVDFLQRWAPEGLWVLTAIGVDRKSIKTVTYKPGEEDDLRTWLDAQVGAKRNVYFHVNTPLRALDKKAQLTDIRSVDWLHVDVDPAPGFDLGEERKRILALLQTKQDGLPEPTLIVYSGGGYQAFWKLDKSIAVDGVEAKAQEAARYNHQIEILLGGDACHNVDRIMRLPGTVNWPNKKKQAKGQAPALAQVVAWSDSVYSLSEFTKAPMVQDGVQTEGGIEVKVSGNVRRIVDLEAELPKGTDRAQVVIVQGEDPDKPLTDDNSRSAWLFYVCCQLVRHDVDDDTIYAIITDPSFRISDSVLDKGNSRSVERYALKQIRSAREFAIDPWLSELNGKYALVESIGGKCRVIKETWDAATACHNVDIQSPEGFLKTYGNRFISIGKAEVPVGKWWLTHLNRRTYSGMVFAPNETHPGVLNLWRGFACDARPGACELFLNHVLANVCRGDRDHYEYLLGWMANTTQNPGKPGQVAVVMRGRQGTGKSFFAKMFGALLGYHFKTVTNPDHLVGTFNATLKDAVVVFADEAFFAGNKKHESALKSLITEDTLQVRALYQDVVEMRNCIHLLMASNEDWVVPARLDDRRFFILEVSDDKRQDHAYFGAIQKQMESGGNEALLHFLLNYDLSGFNVRKVPQTEELRNQQLQTLEPVEAYWFSRLCDGRLMPGHGDWQSEVMVDEMVDAFCAESGRIPPHSAKTRLGTFLCRNLRVAEKGRIRGEHTFDDAHGRTQVRSRPSVWKFPSLDACRRSWDAKFGAYAWPVIPELPREDSGAAF